MKITFEVLLLFSFFRNCCTSVQTLIITILIFIFPLYSGDPVRYKFYYAMHIIVFQSCVRLVAKFVGYFGLAISNEHLFSLDVFSSFLYREPTFI